MANRALKFLFSAGLCATCSISAPAQTSDEMRQILERLDRLEAQNRELTAEVKALKDELAVARGDPPAQAASVEQRLEVQENRTAEQAQVKVEASQRFPLRVTGMALFNTFLNSTASGAAEYPTIAVPGEAASGGATLRQTVLGLDYSGPRTLWDGKISGSLRMDLNGGSGQSLDQAVRLRTASIGIDWKSRGFLVGVDKPIISPREPESLAQVSISPLSGAGNLWLWVPQARFEQGFQFGRQSGMKAQIGVVQTHEIDASSASPYAAAASASYEPGRPGVEGRFEIFSGSDRRVEVAPGFHHSVSHVAGTSVSSNAYSLDWFMRPWHPLEFTGAFFAGQNVAPLGTGGIRQGVVLLAPGSALAVHSMGGWGQVTYRVRPRVWLNLFTGQQDDRNSDLQPNCISKNLAYGANIFFRIAPNVLASFETSQTRTGYLGGSTLLNNHYDLALGYLF